MTAEKRRARIIVEPHSDTLTIAPDLVENLRDADHPVPVKIPVGGIEAVAPLAKFIDDVCYRHDFTGVDVDITAATGKQALVLSFLDMFCETDVSVEMDDGTGNRVSADLRQFCVRTGRESKMLGMMKGAFDKDGKWIPDGPMCLGAWRKELSVRSKPTEERDSLLERGQIEPVNISVEGNTFPKTFTDHGKDATVLEMTAKSAGEAVFKSREDQDSVENIRDFKKLDKSSKNPADYYVKTARGFVAHRLCEALGYRNDSGTKNP